MEPCCEKTTHTDDKDWKNHHVTVTFKTFLTTLSSGSKKPQQQDKNPLSAGQSKDLSSVSQVPAERKVWALVPVSATCCQHDRSFSPSSGWTSPVLTKKDQTDEELQLKGEDQLNWLFKAKLTR